MLKPRSFKGGVFPLHHEKHGKYTAELPIETVKAPPVVYIPLVQHIGAPAKALVKAGDHVRVGEKIGEAQGFVSANVHSSVSGKVKSVMLWDHPSGHKAETVIIENDGLDEVFPSLTPHSDWESLSKEKLVEIVKEAGIVGMGGATFPTHVKLSPPPDKKVDVLLVNAAECEPYLTADDRAMIEYKDLIVEGVNITMKILGVDRAIVGIEDNKPEAIRIIDEAFSKIDGVEIAPLKVKYPQGGEKQLAYALTGRKVPAGGLPADVGIVVQNVSTMYAIAQAVVEGKPLTHRVLSVSGDAVKKPSNLWVPIGTPFQHLLDLCGGLSQELYKVISGGPMMGQAQSTLQTPVTKGCSGLLFFSESMRKLDERVTCIHCGRCVAVCPMGLMPLYIASHSDIQDYEKAWTYGAANCIECGCCAYACPAKLNLVQSVKMAKAALARERQKQKENGRKS
ncbi:electron transport complex subunit RsxC [Gehongia tenuis]|uniref:Ion-translocating oxidoreductase complex subunit C n=1 Tax=Gehongia tenuis TaxID=2763655 RepID=A0A926HQA9_9FIRM|nr:electron transport complex subunit RsxC [Gehongia tenuis]MBC8531560.1 electron transport complex subunit RsxC [Gehongia tenuis]